MMHKSKEDHKFHVEITGN